LVKTEVKQESGGKAEEEERKVRAWEKGVWRVRGAVYRVRSYFSLFEIVIYINDR